MSWEIETVCINHYANHSYPDEPYQTHPTTGDGMNREQARHLIRTGNYDILFFSCDCNNIQHFFYDLMYVRLMHQDKKIIAYTTLDCDEMQIDVFGFMALCDFIGVYSDHSRKRLSEIIPGVKIQTIYLGCEPDFFYPVSSATKSEIKRKYFRTDKRLLLSVARNQWRKDIGRTLYAYHLYAQKNPDCILYLHSKKDDVGGNLPYIAKGLGLGENAVIYTDDTFSEDQGSPREILREIYQAADLFISTSTGEGWGLAVTEAMASGLPVLVPKNTSHIDLIGEKSERGTFIDCGGPDNWYVPYGASMNRRDFCSVSDAVHKIGFCLDHYNLALEKAINAREWTNRHTWDHAKEQWLPILKGFEP